jgi:hypothetical protein
LTYITEKTARAKKGRDSTILSTVTVANTVSIGLSSSSLEIKKVFIGSPPVLAPGVTLLKKIPTIVATKTFFTDMLGFNDSRIGFHLYASKNKFKIWNKRASARYKGLAPLIKVMNSSYPTKCIKINIKTIPAKNGRTVL